MTFVLECDEDIGQKFVAEDYWYQRARYDPFVNQFPVLAFL